MENISLSDEFLIFLIRKNDKDAFAMLEGRYCIFLKSFLVKNGYTSINSFIPYEIVFLDAQMAFYKAIETYEYCQGYFYMYWRLIVRQELGRIIRQEESIFNGTFILSLDETFELHDNDTDLHELIPSPGNEPLHGNFANEVWGRIEDAKDNLLSLEEKMIVAFYSEGFSFREISERLKKSIYIIQKAYYCAIQKLKVEFL